MRYVAMCLSLFFISGMIPVAQGTPDVDDVDNNEWAIYTAEGVQVSIPAGWQPDQSGTRFSTESNEAALVINLRDAPADATLDSLTDRALNRIDNSRGGDVIETGRVMLPIAEATRIDYTVDALNGVERRLRYIVPVDNRYIELIGLARADLNADTLNTYLTTFEQAADTLTAGPSDTWMRYSEGMVSAQVPDTWGELDVANSGLVLSTTDRVASVSFTVRDLETAVPVESLEEQILNLYDTQYGADVGNAPYVNLPVGDALRIRLENVQLSGASDVTHTQIHYVLMRDTYLLIISSGAESNLYDDRAAELERIVNTVQFSPQNRFGEASSG